MSEIIYLVQESDREMRMSLVQCDKDYISEEGFKAEAYKKVSDKCHPNCVGKEQAVKPFHYTKDELLPLAETILKWHESELTSAKSEAIAEYKARLVEKIANLAVVGGITTKARVDAINDAIQAIEDEL